MAIRAAIIGPTGYGGLWLIEILRNHPEVELTYLAARREAHIVEEFPQLLGKVDDEIAKLRPIDPDAIAKEADVVFLGLPHQASMEFIPGLIEAGLRVIDLSADYRISDPKLYEAVYGNAHTDQGNLGKAVYGLSELFRDEIAEAQLIANPGCYPTGAVLGLAPLLRHDLIKPENIIVNGATGVTGGGRTPKPNFHFPSVNEGFMSYGAPGGHRHQPEMEQILERVCGQDVPLLFVPHLLPIDNGILCTIYAEPAEDEDITEDDLFEALGRAYEEEPFVRVRPDLPNVKHVRGANYCDITVRLIDSAKGDPADMDRPPRVVIFTAIDNMMKGASGQATQNMNIMFGLDETMGLE